MMKGSRAPPCHVQHLFFFGVVNFLVSAEDDASVAYKISILLRYEYVGECAHASACGFRAVPAVA
jgi:hypothetical protein